MDLVKHIGTIDDGVKETYIFNTDDPNTHICIYIKDTLLSIYQYGSSDNIKHLWGLVSGNISWVKFNNTYLSMLSDSALKYKIADTFKIDTIMDFLMMYNREQNLDIILE